MDRTGKYDAALCLERFGQAAAADGVPDVLKRAYDFSKDARFRDRTGAVDDAGDAAITHEQAAILFCVVQDLKPWLTIETGFGGGLSAMVFMAAKLGLGQHISIDPWGLDDGKGRKVGAYLEESFSSNFTRIKERSEFALPRLAELYKDQALVSFIDGNHLFETALIDFTYFAFMCPVGGCIAMDDTHAPAIESVVNYLAENRSDFSIEHPTKNMALLWRHGADERWWGHFRPFKVPEKHDWPA